MSDIRWKSRPFLNDDIEKVSALRKVFLDHNTVSVHRSYEPEYYRWKILENPFQRGLIHIAEDNGEVVGMTTVTPKKLLIFGQSVIGAEIGDTFTHPNYQRQGIFSILVNLSREKALDLGINLVYGTPNENSLPGYEKKLDFLQIPSAQVNSLVRPLNMKLVLESRLGSKTLASTFAPLARVLYGSRYRIDSSKNNHQDIQFEEVSTFPENIERLSNTVCSKYDWILERSKLYLDWRFGTNPDSYRLLIVRDSQDILGYLVAKMGRWRNLHVGYLADFLTIENNPRIFEELLYQAVKGFIEANVDMVACWSIKNSYYDRILRSKGFQVHKPIPIICYRKSKIGTEVLARDARWHFTMADSDNI